jgi:phage minor structural protein
MAIIHILDKQTDEIVGTLNSSKGEFYGVRWLDSIKNQNTFDFTSLKKFELLQKRNRLIIQDEDGFFNEFIIFYAEQNKRNEKIIRSNASFVDLRKAKVIEPQTLQGATSATATSFALEGTEWKVGQIEHTNINTITIEEHTDPYTLLQTIATTFGLEINYRVEIKGNKISGRYVDMKKQIAGFEGKEIAFGKDLQNVRRMEDSSRIVTALLGVGPEKDGSRLTVMVEDAEALQRWGRKGQHLIEIFEPQSSSQDVTVNELRTLTENELKKRIDAIVSYECTGASLEHIFGHEHEKIRKGQTVRIKDDGYSPPLYLEARIDDVEKDPVTNKILSFKIGNFIEYKKEDLEKQIAGLKKVINDKIAKLILSTITSSAGDTFKNGTGSTTLTTKVFLAGQEIDIDGTRYTYNWKKYDKNGVEVTGYSKTTKTITVSSDEITEKATFVVEISTDGVVSTSQITITAVSDGQSLYTWVKYATDINGTGISDDPTGRSYIGFAYNKNSPIESINPKDYTWNAVEGSQGVPGTSYYTWLKYADTAAGAGMSDSPTGKKYMGLAHNKTSSTESSDPLDYNWSLIQGDKGDKGDKGDAGNQGIPGPAGTSLFTWVKYADDASGNGMSDLPTNKKYIGLAYNKTVQSESNIPTDYTWALIEGPQGVPGSDRFTWIKYADTPTSGMSDLPDGKKYMGIAYNKTTSVESTNYADYSWSLIQGDKGDKGDTGPTGLPGPQGIAINLFTDSYLKRINSYSSAIITRTTEAPTNRVRVDWDGVGTFFGINPQAADRFIEYVQGVDYMLAYEIRGNITNLNYSYIMRSDGANAALPNKNVSLSTTEWQKIYIPMQPNWSTTQGYFLIGTRDAAAGKWFEVRKAMVYRGDTEIDFIHAPQATESELKTYTDGIAAGLQTQVDGKIETWFYAATPTLTNAPASTWTDDATKDKHIDDLYFNTANGKAYRFKKVSTTYSWENIQDNDIVTALTNAATAQDTADNKRRVFVTQPVPPYDVGDLWVQGVGGDMLRCQTAKLQAASFSANDWVKTTNPNPNLMPLNFDNFGKYGIGQAIGTKLSSVLTNNISNSYSLTAGKALKVEGAVAANNYVFFSPAVSNYNIPVTIGKTYIISAYVYTESQAVPCRMRARANNGGYHNEVNANTSPGEWKRIFSKFTAVTNTLNISFWWDAANVQVWVDCLQLEMVPSEQTQPSLWTPAGYSAVSTYIDEEGIYTGTVQANQIIADLLSAISAKLGNVKIGGDFGDGSFEAYADVDGDGTPDVVGRIDIDGAYYPNLSADNIRGNVVNKWMGSKTITFWIDCNNGNDANTGLSSASPKKNLQAFIANLPKDLNGATITIRAKGSHSGSLVIENFKNGFFQIAEWDASNFLNTNYVWAQFCDYVLLQNVVVWGTGGANAMIHSFYCNYFYAFTCKCYGGANQAHAFWMIGSRFAIDGGEVYGVSDRGLFADRNSQGTVVNGKGSATTSMLAEGGAIINGYGTRWAGSLVPRNGGEIPNTSAWTINTGVASPPAPTPTQNAEQTLTITPSTGDNYSSNGFWTNDEVKQGSWGSAGNRYGLWYADFSAVKGKIIVSATITINRKSGGTYGGRTIYFRTHNYTSRGVRPGGAPAMSAPQTRGPIPVGETLSFDITDIIQNNIASGSDKALGVHTTGSTDYMSLGTQPTITIRYR